MTIDQIREAKQIVEAEISNILNSFVEKTGVEITSIEIIPRRTYMDTGDVIKIDGLRVQIVISL